MERWFKEVVTNDVQFLVTKGEDKEGHYVMVEFIFNDAYYTSRYNADSIPDNDEFFDNLGEQDCFNLIVSVSAGSFEN